MAEVFAAATLNHIGGQGPRAAGKADQRRATVKFVANGAHGVHNIAEFIVHLRRREQGQIFLTADGLPEFRPLARFEIESQAHGVRHRENVGKEDRRVERITL